MTECKCPICNASAKVSTITRYVNEVGYLESLYTCPHCGSYILPNMSLLSVVFGPNDNLFFLCCYLFENREFHDEYNPLRLDRNVLESISKIAPLTVEDKVEKLLTFINNHSSYFGENVLLDSEVIYSRSETELGNLMYELTEQGYIDDKFSTDGYPSASIKIKGIEYIKHKSTEERKDSCFVAMCFNEELNIVYDQCIVPACHEAGYEPVRVDRENYNGDITDRIISQIRTTAFTIADMSGYRGGVYYEAGFARGLGKEVILTCTKEWFDGDPKENKKVHFDINHLNIIVWKPDELDVFRTALTNRIVATMGKGSFVTQN